MEPIKIIVDTREQRAYTFAGIKPCPTIIYKGLQTGDYSLDGCDKNGIIIERKNPADLFGSFGRGRTRLKREFERMSEFNHAALVIECSLADIFLNPPRPSQMNPKAVFRSLTSWSIRYNVHVWPCPDRPFAERLTYILLFQYHSQQTG